MKDPKAALEYPVIWLGTPYLDLCASPVFQRPGWVFKFPHGVGLLYWPAEKIYKENPDKIKKIGISNWSVSYLERLLKHMAIIPAINQIELV